MEKNGVSLEACADLVVGEIRAVLRSIRDESVRNFADALLFANRIVVCGAGRMGIMSSAFAMRLAQLGLRSHVLGEPTTPAITEGDLVVLSSGSGETQTVYDVGVLANRVRR